MLNIFYVVENIQELMFLSAGIASALSLLTCTVFCFPKDE
ncbi:hypothetical protein RNAN_1004 [Rheinheimera nanhaiensis E407-8]|uniref:Uncharacterized protein n=1 Tax=Rheinheimera nanhaiensis E407-8 TaxID=562729 RepID=I1DVF5_9GAMM|nr:hypothetical protein RNAN_1004 [Rheinheimera nanhaiensis E407-8]